MSWNIKLVISILVDLFDMTVGRVMFFTPFASEIIGTAIGCALFGRKGLFYFLEAFDPTEQIDGFLPIATIIALKSRDEHDQAYVSQKPVDKQSSNEDLQEVEQTYISQPSLSDTALPVATKGLNENAPVQSGARLTLQGMDQNGNLAIIKLEDHQLALGREFSLGRHPDLNHLLLNDQSLSRRHCRFLSDSENVFIEDLYSSSGTYVNDQLLDPFVKHKVKESDMLSLGSLQFSISFKS